MTSLVPAVPVRSSARRRPTHWLATVLALGTFAQATSYLVWTDVAGDRLVLRQVRVLDPQAPGLTAAPGARASSPGQVRRPSHVPAPPGRSVSRVSPATVVDGTVVATGLVGLINGVAYLAMGRLLRRRRAGARDCVAEVAEVAEVVETVPAPLPVPATVAGEEPRARAGRTVERTVDAPSPPVEPWPLTSRERIVLFDAGEATRVAHTSLVRLEWDGHDLVTRTSHISGRDVSCLFPAEREAELPSASTMVRVTLLLGGSWVTLTTRPSRHRAAADGHVIDLALMEPATVSAALVAHVSRAQG